MPIVNKKTIYKHIQSLQKRKSISINQNIDLSVSNILNNQGNKFCLYDSGSQSESHIVIFTTKLNLIHFQNSLLWCIIDGTFKTVPKKFTQLYILHGKIFPFIYILMGKKTQKDYENILSILKEKINIKISEFEIMDFELAAFNAFKKILLLPNIYFCLFHFEQCLWQKIQKLGLTKKYNEM